MKKITLKTLTPSVRVPFVTLIAVVASLFLFSFTVQRMYADFLQELGISKTDADKKISYSLIGGYLDAYGAKNARNIALGNRAAVTKDLLNYARQYVNSAAFTKEYTTMKESKKPTEEHIKTPEETRKESIDAYKKSVEELQTALKTADANLKSIFEKALAESKKYLKDAEDPNNQLVANYTKFYPELLKSSKESYNEELKKWEAQYPSNQMHFVKQRLLQFLDETKDIDFAAALTTKNNKKVFVNPAYESKGNRWKMAFRAGKEVIEPARALVQQWIEEIK